jgi:hypothetical protein
MAVLSNMNSDGKVETTDRVLIRKWHSNIFPLINGGSSTTVEIIFLADNLLFAFIDPHNIFLAFYACYQ